MNTPPITKKRKIRYAGIFAIITGISMQSTESRAIFGLFIIGIGIITAIFPSLFMGKKRKEKKEEFVLTDDMIRRFAQMKGGILSINDLTTQTSLNPEEAKKRLETLHLSNKAELRITDTGNLLYDFREDCQLPDKIHGSKLILE